MDLKERFLNICKSIDRPGVEGLIDYLKNSDFFSAPASTRHHGSYEGGLLEHSLNVYDELVRLLGVYPEITAEPSTVAIISLFHDLCKINLYGKEKRNRKDSNGRWESYDAYVTDEKFHYGGHGSKSVFILQNYIKLTAEEAVAINCHMGAYSENPHLISSAYEQFSLAWLLHVADEAATYILENER